MERNRTSNGEVQNWGRWLPKEIHSFSGTLMSQEIVTIVVASSHLCTFNVSWSLFLSFIYLDFMPYL